jgi:glycosyltransferase involved in cell wall biosynthesis
MRTSIIIAAHNEGAALRRTVESCTETCAELDHEIIVVDDASTDDSVDSVEQSFPRVHIHRHQQRLGASPAKATGARQARGEILIFLDGHSKPEYGALPRLARHVESFKHSAVITPAVANLNVENWSNDLSQIGHGYSLDLLTFDCGWLSLDQMRKVAGARVQLYESPSLIGCALAVSRGLYERLWGFDPHMLYWGVEDLDFGLKCWLMGCRILHDPEVVVGHRFRSTFDNYEVPLEYPLMNQLRMARKNFSESVWADWLERSRQRNQGGLQGHPEGLWARAWHLFESRRASAEQERAHLHARRTRDEFWYAQRFGQSWPRLQTAAAGEGLRFFLTASPSPRPSHAPSPSPSPTPCKITSQTVATTPPNRTRTRVGVGERVTLRVTPGPANWSVTGRGTVSPATGSTVTFTAADRGGTATVTARVGTKRCMITFTVVEPSGIVMRRHPGSGIRHTHNRPDSGLQTDIYLTPSDVSFQNVQYHEVDVPAVANGVYAPFNGVGHDPHPATISVDGVVAGLGSKANGIDSIYSGDPGTAPPFAPGSITFNIPYEFKVGSGAFKRFATVVQRSTLAADGVTLTSSKAGASITIKVSDPTSTF